MSVPSVVKRMGDTARDIARTVDEFGNAWEGASSVDVRDERKSEPIPRAGLAAGGGLLLLLLAVLLISRR